MKKILFLLLCLLLCLCACNIDDTPAVHIHEFGSWSVERPASCTQEELLQRSCACGETETQAGQPVSAHNYTWDVQQALSCISDEVKLGTCADCGATTTQTQPATGVHTYDAKGQCTGCTRKVSVGFVYALSQDGKTYTITGRGTCADTAVTVPESYMGIPVTAIGPNAFRNWGTLKSISFPDTVTAIGSYAFAMTGLTDIALPPKLEALEAGILSGTAVKELVLPEGLRTIRKYALMGSYLDRLTIPDSVTDIGTDAFYMCRIGTVKIGSGCEAIVTALQGISWLQAIELSESDTAYRLIDGVLFSRDGKTLLLYPNGRAEQSYTVPQGVTVIAAGAFGDCAGSGNELRSLTLPESLTDIRAGALTGCFYLNKLNFQGSRSKWDAITKETGWDTGLSCTIVCSDSQFKPEG